MDFAKGCGMLYVAFCVTHGASCGVWQGMSFVTWHVVCGVWCGMWCAVTSGVWYLT